MFDRPKPASVPAGEFRYIGSRSRLGVVIPLTPVLSLGERENVCQHVERAGTPGSIERLASMAPEPEPRFARELPTIPPLPFGRGEGGGEGKQAADSSRRLDATTAPCRHTWVAWSFMTSRNSIFGSQSCHGNWREDLRGSLRQHYLEQVQRVCRAPAQHSQPSRPARRDDWLAPL